MKTTKHNPSVKLLFSDASGVYIPKRFATEIKRGAISGVKPIAASLISRMTTTQPILAATFANIPL